MLEDIFARAMQMDRGFDFILERPMALTLSLLVLSLLPVRLPSHRERRARKPSEGVSDGD